MAAGKWRRVRSTTLLWRLMMSAIPSTEYDTFGGKDRLDVLDGRLKSRQILD